MKIATPLPALWLRPTSRKLLITILFLCTEMVLYAQPPVDGFLKGKGNLDVVGSFTAEYFAKYYAADGLTSIGRNTLSLSAFGAAGLTDWLDVQVSIPLVMASGNVGLQDGSIYLKAAPLNRSIGSGRLTIILAEGFSNPLMNYATEGIGALGQKATAIDSRAVVQWMSGSGFFIMAQGGYVYRSNPVPSSKNFAVKAGLATADYYLDVWFDFQQGEAGNSYREKVDVMGTLIDPSFRTFTVSYSKIGATYYKPFSDTKGMAIGAAYVLNGKNIGQAISASFALIYKIKYLKGA